MKKALRYFLLTLFGHWLSVSLVQVGSYSSIISKFCLKNSKNLENLNLVYFEKDVFVTLNYTKITQKIKI